MIEIMFPGGVQVEAALEGFTVLTDQPVSSGGEGKAPSPFDLFLASVATCSGFYALRFCQERGLPTEGLRVSMETERDEVHNRTARLHIAITLPEGFPEKYRAALLRSVNQCTVKRHLEEPPAFELTLLAPSLELVGAIA
jgi:ribosomal protein S12 methylthiotransferase accessory factor